MEQRKRVDLVDNGQTLQSFSLHVVNSISMIVATRPEWMLDAYHGTQVDVDSLNIGARVRFVSMIKDKIEETELRVKSVKTEMRVEFEETEREGHVDHIVDVNDMVTGDDKIAGQARMMEINNQ